MKIFLLIFVFLMVTLASVYCDDAPEMIFLKNLEKLTKLYGNRFAPNQSISNALIKSDIERKNILNYKWSIPKQWLILQSICYQFLDGDSDTEEKFKIRNFLNSNRAITPKKLYDYFKPKILSGQFNMKSGDIVMILPHVFESFTYAYYLNSPYSHSDMIWITPDNRPLVIMISNVRPAIVPLSEYLLGYYKKLDNFSIYRYNKKIDLKKLDDTLSFVVKHFNNIYFDMAFVKSDIIHDLEAYFSKPQFLYCGEFIYRVYEYVLGSDNFSSNNYTSVRRMYENTNKQITPLQDFFIKYAEIKEKQENAYLIDQKIFYQSKDFSPLVHYKKEITIKNVMESQSLEIKRIS